MSVQQLLQDAQSALEKGAGGRALLTLLESWQITRDPTLGKLVEALSARMDVAPLLVRGTTRERVKQWLKRANAKNPLDLPALTESLMLFWPSEPGCLVTMFEELESHRPDPRIQALGLSRVTEMAHAHHCGGKVWPRLIRLLLVHADARGLAVVRELEKATALRDPGVETADKLGKAARRLERQLKKKPPAKLDDAQRELMDRLGEQVKNASLTAPDREPEVTAAPPTEALWTAVYENLEDDGARMVLADALLEGGDPRGELIALQLDEKRDSRASLTRQRALIREHGERFTDGLGPLLRPSSLRFRRGFLVDCRVKPIGSDRLDGALAHRAWRTVEAITFDKGARSNDCLLSPDMTCARALHEITPAVLRALVAEPDRWPVEHLSVAEKSDGRLVNELLGLQAGTSATAPLPRLRTLALFAGPQRAVSIATSRFSAGLETLICTNRDRLAHWLKTDIPLDTFVGISTHQGWMLRRRTPEGFAFRFRVPRMRPGVMRLLPWQDMKELIFEVPKSSLAEQRAALETVCRDIGAPRMPDVVGIAKNAPLPWRWQPDGV